MSPIKILLRNIITAEHTIETCKLLYEYEISQYDPLKTNLEDHMGLSKEELDKYELDSEQIIKDIIKEVITETLKNSDTGVRDFFEIYNLFYSFDSTYIQNIIYDLLFENKIEIFDTSSIRLSTSAT